MILLYILGIAYILAINFYSFLLVKSLRDKERAQLEEREFSQEQPAMPQKSERVVGKLCAAGALGGAITIYICMFVMKYRRNDLLLMVLMPLLGVLNVYVFVLLFKSGFSFFFFR